MKIFLKNQIYKYNNYHSINKLVLTRTQKFNNLNFLKLYANYFIYLMILMNRNKLY